MIEENRTIYSFWLGDQNKKKELEKYYYEVNKIIFPWKVILGPTEEEHSYLMNNSSFYRKSYNNGIYSFCSDVYRSYIIHKNGGLYVDSGCKYNFDKIVDFLSTIEKYDFVFVLERPLYLWSGFFYSKKRNDSLVLEFYNHLNKLSKKKFKHIEIMTIIMSHYVFKKFGYNLEDNANILVMKSPEFDWDNIDNVFYMNPTGSWWEKKDPKLIRPKSPKECWKITFNTFKNEAKDPNLILKRKIFSNIIFTRMLTYSFFNKIFKFLLRIYKVIWKN